MNKLALAAACLAVASASCAQVQRWAMTPEERRAHDLASCTSKDDKTWDLGTGRAADVRRTAPGFYALRPAGWTPPGTFFAADAALREKKGIDERNERRLRALEQAKTPELRIEPTSLDDVDVYDVVPAARHVGATVHVVPVAGGGAALVVTPGHCPHVVAADACRDERLRTTLSVDGTVPCIGALSVSDGDVLASVRGGPAEPVDFKEPLKLGADGLGPVRGLVRVDLRLRGARRAFWSRDVQVGDVAGATPDEVLTLLAAPGTRGAAAVAYQKVDPTWRTPDFDARVADLRAARLKKLVAAAATPEEAVGVLSRVAIGRGLPGDDRLRAILKPRLRDALGQVAADGAVTREKLELGENLVGGLRRWAPSLDIGAQAKQFEDRYGPAVSSGGVGNDADRATFASLFPKSPYAAAIEKNEAKERAEAAKKAAAAQNAADADDAWQDLEQVGDQIAQNRFRASFARKYAPPTLRTERAIRAVTAYTRGMIDEQFCPAKKKFIKLAGSADYRRRAAAHCKDEPPTGSGVNGAEITLTSQCRVAFATPCP